MEPSDEIHQMSEPWLQRKAKERVAVAIGFAMTSADDDESKH
jgi:hypothetical protein